MADKLVVKAEVRETRGKNEARRMRTTGRIPAVVYGNGGEAIAVSVDLKEIAAVLRAEGVESVFSLDIAGVGVETVRFQDRQIDPVKSRLMHADLVRVA